MAASEPVALPWGCGHIAHYADPERAAFLRSRNCPDCRQVLGVMAATEEEVEPLEETAPARTTGRGYGIMLPLRELVWIRQEADRRGMSVRALICEVVRLGIAAYRSP